MVARFLLYFVGLVLYIVGEVFIVVLTTNFVLWCVAVFALLILYQEVPKIN